LLRNRTHISNYERALQEAGIPYQGSEPGSLLESVEIQDMLALLDTLIAPYNSLSLARVLRCPLFSCTEQDLIFLAEQAKHNKQNWFGCLCECDDSSSGNLQLASEMIQRWHEQAGKLPVHDLLDKIYSEADVLNRFEQAFPEHLQSRVIANLMRFIELALEIDSGRYPSLSQFRSRLATLRKQEKDGPDPALPNNQGQRLQILTIHSAKGLEAPIVFIADTASTPKERFSYNAHINWPSGADKPQHIQLLLNSKSRDEVTQSLLDAQRQRDMREEANLLYVAVTRARQLLYISGVEATKNKDKGWYKQISRHLEKLELLNENGGYVAESNKMPSIEVAKATEITTELSKIQLPAALEQRNEYPATYKVIAPSQIMDSEESYSPSFIEREQARLRGNIIHRILERCSDDSLTEEKYTEILAEFSNKTDVNSFDSCWKEAKDTLDNPVHAEIFTRQHYIKAWNEVPIIYQIDDMAEHTVNGIIDRLVQYQDRLLIIDYKSSQLSDNESLSQHAELYRSQLGYYVKGIQKCWPNIKVEAGIIFTASSQFIKLF